MITHAKISAKSDGTDASQVRPSDWNASHVIDGLAIPGVVSTVDLAGTGSHQMVVMNGTDLVYTLAVAPTANQVIWVRNQDVATDLTIARNAQPINGLASDLTVPPGGAVQLWFVSGSGWFVMGAA